MGLGTDCGSDDGSCLADGSFSEPPVEDDAEVFLVRLVDLRGVLFVVVLLVRFL